MLHHVTKSSITKSQTITLFGNYVSKDVQENLASCEVLVTLLNIFLGGTPPGQVGQNCHLAPPEILPVMTSFELEKIRLWSAPRQEEKDGSYI